MCFIGAIIFRFVSHSGATSTLAGKSDAAAAAAAAAAVSSWQLGGAIDGRALR